jgi:prophage DNA circulation protein
MPISQPITPFNVIPGLEAFTWRGLVAPPYDTAGINGGYNQSERRYPYIDGAGHDNVGANPIPINFTLYFLNSLRVGMFPDLFTSWRDAVAIDGSPGDLVHPLLGKLRAVPLTWNINLSAAKTSGVVMNVSFSTTVEDPEKAAEFSTKVSSVESQAAQADIDIQALGIPFPGDAKLPSLLDLIRSLEGQLFSARLTIEGALNQVIGIVDGLVDAVERLNDHRAWAAEANLKGLRNSLVDLGNAIGESARKTAEFIIQTSSPLDVVARITGNTVGEIITLNPSKLRSPFVESGESVKYFAE